MNSRGGGGGGGGGGSVAHLHLVTSPSRTAVPRPCTPIAVTSQKYQALLGNHAPKTVANFVGLAQGTKDYSTENASGGASGPFYDGAVFHRVIDGFMSRQRSTGTGRGGPGYSFVTSSTLSWRSTSPTCWQWQTQAPARTAARFTSSRSTSGRIWNRKHTIFGKISDQLTADVVDAIATTPTDRRDRPTDPVVIDSITVS